MSASLLLVFATATVGSGLAQVSGVVPIRLARPAYPAIALSARVSGDVEVAVGVRADGTVESAVTGRGAHHSITGPRHGCRRNPASPHPLRIFSNAIGEMFVLVEVRRALGRGRLLLHSGSVAELSLAVEVWFEEALHDLQWSWRRGP
jgi:hypothetical protein